MWATSQTFFQAALRAAVQAIRKYHRYGRLSCSISYNSMGDILDYYCAYGRSQDIFLGEMHSRYAGALGVFGVFF